MASNSDPSDTVHQDGRAKDFLKFKTYAAWTFVVGAPILIILPPRKLDLNTFALSAAFAVSANHIYRDRNPDGRGILDDIGVKYFGRPESHDARSKGIANLFNPLPTEKAAEIQDQLRAAKEASMATKEDLEKYKANQRFGDRSLPEKIWMGSEAEGWKEKRLREEQKALAEGKGYGDLIMEHIWDVWNWGKTGDQKRFDDETKNDPEK
ncbi:hypothetical protein BGW36DRAFT_297703 [Talaromyces proteolyticus]|uniref:Uncharacterized protein n=1 Tax=Talaromyces proteolyticus TaxID=1131652 RepID=A0AAD4KTS6_9EURO|nr:uncharacterized protein BGW36DRAFT_297703 [Talaromyces proteolyticus]KAH8696720.1 hypothetical protein BGW36DRAFT_297703 [Talaromyces proteolyticus]